MAFSSDLANLGDDGFADSGGVKIHYVTKGTGPLVLLIHGIPGFWYDWRNQIPVLAQHFQVVAIDQRGFNLSDQPQGVENYTLDELVGDINAVDEPPVIRLGAKARRGKFFQFFHAVGIKVAPVGGGAAVEQERAAWRQLIVSPTETVAAGVLSGGFSREPPPRLL